MKRAAGPDWPYHANCATAGDYFYTSGENSESRTPTPYPPTVTMYSWRLFFLATIIEEIP